ncbi:hypothetical protein D6D29_04542 [Aureobasidium pullulans]|nr:hypothetical protein D6D29_04542 [Aureobasidium pullulans]
MAPISQDEHILLLFSCVKNSKGAGQIDWSGVATDRKITSNAASKRYNKLVKHYEIGDAMRRSSSRVPSSTTKNVPGNEDGEQGDLTEDLPGAERKGNQDEGKSGASKKRKTGNLEDVGECNDKIDYDAPDLVAREEEHIEAEMDGSNEIVA